MFELKNIKYKNIINIDHLIIKDNDVTVINGKSGAGKSTLLKLLNNLISPDSGEIYYNSKNIMDISPITLRRKITMQSQFPVIYNSTIRDNLNIGFKLRDLADTRDKTLKEVLKIVRLDKDLEIDAKTLSGGEKTRLAIARLFLLNPEVILLDEPGASLDNETEFEIIKNVVQLVRKKNIKLIIVSHNDATTKFADEIITFENGKLKR
ncbi:MAG: ABC transporter ATP-binding protein [Ezakiella sp.]|nr:ABC transporter ATP-binding protein [Ezakiella sp.]MDD7472076.1 ABC transporter ATP-binding protein [Bacillota bacterium]MDY3924040.1 ABC transporter ATP-binding protein [Ezakiella sp.]